MPKPKVAFTKDDAEKNTKSALMKLFNHLDKSSLKSVAVVSKSWNDASKENSVWERHFRFTNWHRVENNDKFIYDYKIKMSKYDKKNIIQWEHDPSQYGELIVQENLIPVKEIVAFSDSYSKAKYLAILFSEDGLSALRQKLITFDHVKRLPSADYLFYLLHENAREAFKSKLLHIEEAIRMPTADHLKYLLVMSPESNGIEAMKRGLITAKIAAQMPTAEHVKWLVSHEGISALETGIITPEAAIDCQTVNDLVKLAHNKKSDPGCAIC